MNTAKIRGRMAERRITQAQVAAHIGISEQSFNQKLGNKKKFTVPEFREMMRFLEFTADEAVEILFIP